MLTMSKSVLRIKINLGSDQASTAAAIITEKSSKRMSREITVEELQQHNKPHDAWMAVKGKVYDVTDFIPKHPGGKGTIMQGVGKDATELFNKAHNYITVDKVIPGKQIGVLKR